MTTNNAETSEDLPPVAWIGIGKMGLPIAVRLAAAGVSLVAYDRDPARMNLAAEHGIDIAPSPVEAVASRRVIFTSLPDDAAIYAAILSPTGLLSKLAPGSILVETSTISVEASSAIDDAATARGISYLRVPVSGNAAIAHTGELTCFVSGPKSAFERVQPLLNAYTYAQIYLGESEEARFAKLAVNLMIGVSAAMMAESLALARKGGVAWHDILAVLDSSAASSPMVKSKTPQLARRDFNSTFSCRQMVKDLDLILSAGHRAGVPLQLAAQVRELYGSLVAQGHGDSDYIASVRHVERLSGLDEP